MSWKNVNQKNLKQNELQLRMMELDQLVLGKSYGVACHKFYQGQHL